MFYITCVISRLASLKFKHQMSFVFQGAVRGCHTLMFFLMLQSRLQLSASWQSHPQILNSTDEKVAMLLPCFGNNRIKHSLDNTCFDDFKT